MQFSMMGILRCAKDMLLVLLSSAATVLSFPDHDWSILAWGALVPLLLVIRRKPPGMGFGIATVWGMGFISGVFHWITHVPAYSWLHHALLILCFSLPFGFLGLAFTIANRNWGMVPALASVPFFWVSMEYLRSNLSFLSLPWALLAHTQYRYPAVIQWSSITGAWGITFLICLVNAAAAAVLAGILNSGVWRHSREVDGGSIRSVFQLTGLAGLAMFLLLLPAHMEPSGIEGSRNIKVSLIQANIPQESKWDPAHAAYIMEVYSELTRSAGLEKPHIIVWPETATPRSVTQDPDLFRQVQNLAKETGAWILLGSSQEQKFQGKEVKGLRHTNSAFLIDPDFKTPHLQRYDKMRLLPFGEYLPLKSIIPWAWIHVPDVQGYVPGREPLVFDAGGFRFGTTICWENIFPEMARHLVGKGARCIVNITNEAWFGETAAPYQFLAMSVFRAVENRVHVIRCANTGVSCIIDPEGRIQRRLADASGRDVFVRGVLTDVIATEPAESLYSRMGDWFAVMSVLVSAYLILFSAGRQGKSFPDGASAPFEPPSNAHPSCNSASGRHAFHAH